MLNQISSSTPLKMEDITCAGKDCPNEGKYPLTILYLNKFGWFCDGCKRELIQNKLIAEEGES